MFFLLHNFLWVLLFYCPLNLHLPWPLTHVTKSHVYLPLGPGVFSLRMTLWHFIFKRNQLEIIRLFMQKVFYKQHMFWSTARSSISRHTVWQSPAQVQKSYYCQSRVAPVATSHHYKKLSKEHYFNEYICHCMWPFFVSPKLQTLRSVTFPFSSSGVPIASPTGVSQLILPLTEEVTFTAVLYTDRFVLDNSCWSRHTSAYNRRKQLLVLVSFWILNHSGIGHVVTKQYYYLAIWRAGPRWYFIVMFHWTISHASLLK